MNRLASPPAPFPVGEAPLPRVSALNVAEQDPSRADPALRAPEARVVRPSSIVALGPAAVQSSPNIAAPCLFGLNDGNAVLVGPPAWAGVASRLQTVSKYYLGFTDLQVAGPPRVSPDGLYRPVEYGAVPLLAFGDVIQHAVHGLTGALIGPTTGGHAGQLDGTGDANHRGRRPSL